MDEVQVRMRLSAELASKIDQLVLENQLGDSRSSVCSSLIEKAVEVEKISNLDSNKNHQQGDYFPPENRDHLEQKIDQILVLSKQLEKGPIKTDFDPSRVSKLVAGEIGTLRAHLMKEIFSLKTDNFESNSDLSRRLTDAVNSAKIPLKFSGILAAILFAVVALFSALKVYTIEEAKKPLIEELERAREFQSDMSKLVCSSSDGVVEFSPIFVAQFCGYKSMNK